MERDDKSNADERAAAERAAPTRTPVAGNGMWERVEQTSAFEEMMRKKRAWLIPIVVFYCVFYMAWPVLTELTTVLDGRAIGAMSWAVVYGFEQYLMVLIVAHLFLRQSNKWDELTEKARQEASEERTTA